MHYYTILMFQGESDLREKAPIYLYLNQPVEIYLLIYLFPNIKVHYFKFFIIFKIIHF